MIAEGRRGPLVWDRRSDVPGPRAQPAILVLEDQEDIRTLVTRDAEDPGPRLRRRPRAWRRPAS